MKIELILFLVILIELLAGCLIENVINIVKKRKYKRSVQQAEKIYSRMQKVQQQAEFVALATTYEKGVQE